MKLMFLISAYGSRPRVMVDYRQALFFRGEPPPNDTLITVEMPGLTSTMPEAVLRWLTRRAREQGAEASRGRLGGKASELAELDEDLWRPAKLEDVLDAHNWSSVCWYLSRHFPPEDFRRLLADEAPRVQRALDEALALEGAERARALAKIHPYEQRVFSILYQRPGAIDHDRLRLLERAEQARVDELKGAGFDVDAWIACAEELHHPTVRALLLRDLSKRLGEAGDGDATRRALERLRRVGALRDAVAHDTVFWSALSRVLVLDGNAEGLTVSLAHAEEVTVVLGWEALSAKRIGRIVPGRSALKVAKKGGDILIRGERKLAFAVQRAGGELRKLGNTLTMPRGMGDALLTVERIDTLANLDPKRALALTEALDLPSHHPVFDAAERAEEDIRYARILADLLVELLVGVDADVARRLARTKARANRR